jgi:hypothetical protein
MKAGDADLCQNLERVRIQVFGSDYDASHHQNIYLHGLSAKEIYSLFSCKRGKTFTGFLLLI